MSDRKNNLLSHEEQKSDLTSILSVIKTRLLKEGDKEHALSSELIELTDELSQCKLGRFLLENKGLNGFWTDVIVTYPENKDLQYKGLEKIMLEKLPSIIATQERFQIFKTILQKQVKDGVVMVSIPCGLMRDLLQLDFTGVKDFKLIGIDLDSNSLENAKDLAKSYGVSTHCDFLQMNAWEFSYKEKFNVITSNGLNIYEPDKAKIIELFREFHSSLKSQGVLITSFLTYPPDQSSNCEWDFSKIDEMSLLMQRKMFIDILQVKWQCYSSSKEIKEQLTIIGFKEIEIVYDSAKIFPTVIAVK